MVELRYNSKMNIAITGATGLLGNSLVEFFANRGMNVYVLIKDENSSLKLDNGVNKVYGNINTKQDVDYFVHRSLPSYFVHLAAQTQAYDSLKYPYNTFYTNSVGTLNILESLREYSATKAIVVASSDKAYGELRGSEYLESSPLDGIYPYDASKAVTDIICRSYRSTYSMPIVTTRACNIYGKKDYNQQRLIPAIINAFKTGKPFVMRNSGDDIREYIHVDDVVKAYERILDYISKGGVSESFNISSGERLKTREVFQLIQNCVDGDIPLEVKSSNTKEIKKQFMNSDLLRSSTGWRPQMSFQDSLRDIVDWYLKN
jgi:CDP-glucose 4,6-dehydratase